MTKVGCRSDGRGCAIPGKTTTAGWRLLGTSPSATVVAKGWWLVSPACSVMTTPAQGDSRIAPTRDCRRCVGSLLFSCESPDGLGTHDRPIILELGLEFQSDYSTKPVRLMLSTK